MARPRATWYLRQRVVKNRLRRLGWSQVDLARVVEDLFKKARSANDGPDALIGFEKLSASLLSKALAKRPRAICALKVRGIARALKAAPADIAFERKPPGTRPPRKSRRAPGGKSV